MIFGSLKRTSRSTEALAILLTVLVGILLSQVRIEPPFLHAALRMFFGILFAFVLPGYALFLLILGEKLTLADRVLVSLGISLVVDILLAFAINLTAPGLNLVTWTVGLGGVTIAASLAALILSLFDKVENDSGYERIKAHAAGLNWNLRNVVLCLVAGALVLSALVMTRGSAARQNNTGFTQFWLISEGVPAQAGARIGIKNVEGKSVVYRVHLAIDGKLVQVWDAVPVKTGEHWEVVASLPPAQSPDEVVEAYLFLAEKPSIVYRWAKFER